jgi:O-methyltransferase
MNSAKLFSKLLNRWRVDHVIKNVCSNTLLSPLKLRSLARLSEQVLAQNIAGDFVECGVYKGGSAALIANILKQDQQRKLWLYDGFQGMPMTTDKDGAEASNAIGGYKASENDVIKVMNHISIKPQNYSIIKGMFNDTFANHENLPDKVAFLHCDADWYDSVSLVLNTFYERMPVGACVVLDDFGYWEGCRRAFYDFCKLTEEAPLLERISYDQAYWFKGRETNRKP